MIANPIMTRESRTRWRGARAFLLMLAYAAILAVATGWRYGTFAPGIGDSVTSSTGIGRASFVGRELFLMLSALQIIGWMILAPALTATGLAGERERGLLEGVQLSRMSPLQILWGKAMSALLFIVLMMPVALPIAATSFLLGGVAPQEVVIITLLQLVTAINGAGIGLFFSSRSRRAQGALAMSFIFAAAWGIGSFLSFTEWQNGATALGPMTEWSGITWAFFMALLGWSNPVMATYEVINPMSGAALTRLPSTTLNGVLDYAPLWVVNIVLQLLMSAILLSLATRSLRRPLPDMMLSDRRWTDPVRERFAQLMAASAAHAANARERAASRMARQAGNALLWELPLDKLINFRNPILRREVRGKFRWRRGSIWTTVGQAIFALIPAGLYVTLLFAVFFPAERAGTWRVVTTIGLAILMLSCAVMGAGAITREREGGTWEGLHLSLLPPREILLAKFVAPLIACFYYLLPILPVLLFYVNYGLNLENRYGVPLPEALATALILVGASAFCVAWGLFISSVCERTVTAVTWTLATLLLLLVFPLIVLGELMGVDSGPGFWHPFLALNQGGSGVLYAIFSLPSTLLLLLFSNIALRRSTGAKRAVKSASRKASTAMSTE